MRRFATLAFLSPLAAVLMTLSAGAGYGSGPARKHSQQPVIEQTVDSFKAAVSKGGMMVMSTVDQANMLKMTGLQMKGTLLLVGNPTVGKQVFEKDPGAGLYL